MVDLPDPNPDAGELRVHVHSAGLNPVDWKMRAGHLPMQFATKVTGHDGAGVIDAVGDGVNRDYIGRRVWFCLTGWHPDGACADYVCLRPDDIAPLPDEATFAQGAGLGIPYITAHRCLSVGRPLKTGSTVLVHGGAGAVGMAAIQLARYAGARIVTTVSSEHKATLARAAGADAVVNYRTPNSLETLQAAAPDGVDLVVNMAPGDNTERNLAVLRRHGSIAVYGVDGEAQSFPIRAILRQSARLVGVLLYDLTPEMLSAARDAITTALHAQALWPAPEHHFRLEDISSAHESVEGGAVGKVVVDLA